MGGGVFYFETLDLQELVLEFVEVVEDADMAPL